jgi:hypothetical protein
MFKSKHIGKIGSGGGHHKDRYSPRPGYLTSTEIGAQKLLNGKNSIYEIKKR